MTTTQVGRAVFEKAASHENMIAETPDNIVIRERTGADSTVLAVTASEEKMAAQREVALNDTAPTIAPGTPVIQVDKRTKSQPHDILSHLPPSETLATAALPGKKPSGHDTPPKGYPSEREKYADPKNFKYPLDTEAHVRAAWSYIHMPKNAAKYSSGEVASMKGRIRAAAEKHGIALEAK